jgi:release factor glutamine methyltransferase
MTLTDALRSLAQAGIPRLEAQNLLLMALGRDPHDRAWLLAHDTDALDESTHAQLQTLVQRHRDGEPMGYLRGEQEFFGLPLQVDSRVLVPRPDTETLVQWALEVLDTQPSPASAIDLGTGSGAIALALASQRPGLAITATDASEAALAVAGQNAERLALPLRLAAGRWFEAVPGQRFHLAVSNPPYIAEGDPHLPALRHEPITALTAGPDGLDDIRTLVAQAPSHLESGGWLVLEHGHDQAPAVQDLLRQTGFAEVSSRTDLAGIARCTGGRWPAAR